MSTYQNALASTTCCLARLLGCEVNIRSGLRCVSDDQAVGRGVCGRLRLQGGPDAWSQALFISRVCRIEQDGNCVPCGEGLVCPVGSTVENLKQNIKADTWRADEFTVEAAGYGFSVDSLSFLRPLTHLAPNKLRILACLTS